MKKKRIFLGKLLAFGFVLTSTVTVYSPVLANEVTSTIVTESMPNIAEDVVYAQETVLSNKTETTTIPLQLLGINDFHGALNTTGTAYIESASFKGAGTATLLASYLNTAEKNFKLLHPTGTTLRVQAGDMVGASPANSGLLQDEPTIKVLNRMNFTLGTLGNHEFDEGLDEYNRILTGTAPLPGLFNGITENYQREASNTEIVIANMVDKQTGTIPFGWKPYTTRTITVDDKSVTVGFIGIVTTEVPSLVLKKYHADYVFMDEATTIAKYAEILRKSGVNAVVVLAHIPATSTNGVALGEAATIIEQVNTIYPENSIDAFFAGHNHQYTNGIAGTTRIIQSTSQGKAYIDLIGELDPETQDFVTIPDAVVTPVLPNESIVADEEIQEIVAEADALVTTVASEKIGTAIDEKHITRDVNSYKESAVGNLVTDGQRFIAQQLGYDVDFAMTNNGGIRSDLLVQSDKSITWGAAQNVQPFGNILQVVEMSGAQIEQVLNEQYDEDERYFLQISGLSYVYTDHEDSNQPFKVHQTRSDSGALIDANATYQVIINDFLLGGGDGFQTFTEATLLGAIDPDTETFINFIKAQEASQVPINGKITGRKKYQSLADIQQLKEDAILAIKVATIFPDIREDHQEVVAQTIAGATIITQVKDQQNSSFNTVVADENGVFTVDLTSLSFDKESILTFTITDSEHHTVVFEQPVLEKEWSVIEKDGEDVHMEDEKNNVELNLEKIHTTSYKNHIDTKNNLPTTGENETAYSIIGLFLVGTVIVYLSKKKLTPVR